VTDLTWFRAPTDDRPHYGAQDFGTLNACYVALDIHVIRGRADDRAMMGSGVERTFAQLLTDVGAFAGVLRAFGIGAGDEVLASGLTGADDVVVQLAVARLGAVLVDAASATAPTVAVHDTTPAETAPDGRVVITIDTSSELDKATLMRAGSTDPAGCADVPGDQPLRIITGQPVATASHLAEVLAGRVDDPVFGPLMIGRAIIADA